MKRLTTIALFFCKLALAGDSDWLCTEESSERRNDTILACGIGIAHTESLARKAAFMEALAEFDLICRVDSSCDETHSVPNPLRTQCIQVGGGYKCYRLVSFSVPTKEISKVPTIPYRSQHKIDPYQAEEDRMDRIQAGIDRYLEQQISLIH